MFTTEEAVILGQLFRERFSFLIGENSPELCFIG